MDIQQYIAADKELLLNLNGSQSLFWDGFMWVAAGGVVELAGQFALVTHQLTQLQAGGCGNDFLHAQANR